MNPLINNKAKNIILLSLILLSYSLLTYNLFWTPLCGTILICFFSFKIWNHRFTRNMGIKANTRTLAVALLILTGTLIATFFLIKDMSMKNGIPFIERVSARLFTNAIHAVGQTLNEELILGGLLVLGIHRKLNNRHKMLSVVLISLLFSVLHFWFYQFWVSEAHRGTLSLLTITNLFLFGFVRNLSISYFGHIYYAWSIHLGWNLVFLGSFIAPQISESKKFNIYVGSVSTTLLMAIALGIAIAAVALKKRHRGGNP